MNRIDIVNDKITKKNIDKSIDIDYIPKDDCFGVSTIDIMIKIDTRLEMLFNTKETSKLNISINVDPNVKLTLFELKHGNKMKTKYTIILNEGSTLEHTKLYDATGMRELSIIDLNGIKASYNSTLTTLATEEEKYDILINHNAKDTESSIINHGITNDDGSIIFNVTSVVEKGITGCVVNQKSHIVMNNNSLSEINPNLLIDEYDVSANHSAYIGGFNPEDIFYLNTRGISQEKAVKLLTMGFIKSGLVGYLDDDCVKEIVGDYNA